MGWAWFTRPTLSLRRRVALKVLPFAATMNRSSFSDSAMKHWPRQVCTTEHIVPVYAVGCERGVHYYAMQFIDGQTLRK